MYWNPIQDTICSAGDAIGIHISQGCSIYAVQKPKLLYKLKPNGTAGSSSIHNHIDQMPMHAHISLQYIIVGGQNIAHQRSHVQHFRHVNLVGRWRPCSSCRAGHVLLDFVCKGQQNVIHLHIAQVFDSHRSDLDGTKHLIKGT